MNIYHLLGGLLLTQIAVLPLAYGEGTHGEGIHSMESLERERASLINVMTDEQLDVNSRAAQIKRFYRRLTDIERMVLRDERLLGNQDATVQRAFNNYDLTFLVHASAEAKKDVTAHWLTQSGLSTATLMSTKMGRR